MSTNKEKDIYLKDGKLDLSLLDEETIQEIEPEKYSTILEDLESMDLNNTDISSVLEEMAMIFEKDEYDQACDKEKREEEMKEFEKRD
ncbi:MAG TPA: hypothetical protein GX707_07555 [Epulopiscium sp.]|nr:hypothetical protein [Candidatus Epulonipiscium sp.]